MRGIDERRTVGAQLQKLAEGEAGMGISNFLNFLLSSSYLSGFVLRRRLNDFFLLLTIYLIVLKQSLKRKPQNQYEEGGKQSYQLMCMGGKEIDLASKEFLKFRNVSVVSVLILWFA